MKRIKDIMDEVEEMKNAEDRINKVLEESRQTMDTLEEERKNHAEELRIVNQVGDETMQMIGVIGYQYIGRYCEEWNIRKGEEKRENHNDN